MCSPAIHRASPVYSQPMYKLYRASPVYRHFVVCKHLEYHGILTPQQHGFRPGFSCETQLVSCIYDWAKSLDRGFRTDIAIFDFSKAFGSCDTSTDRPTTLSVKELTTPSVKNSSFTLIVVSQYTLTETHNCLVALPLPRQTGKLLRSPDL